MHIHAPTCLPVVPHLAGIYISMHLPVCPLSPTWQAFTYPCTHLSARCPPPGRHLHIHAPTCLPVVPHLAGIYTSYRPFLKSDGTLVKLLSSSESLPGRRPVEAQNVIIRKHALELTTSFVIPLVVCRLSHVTDRLTLACHPSLCRLETYAFLVSALSQERYLASLMPLKKDVLPWRRPPQLRPFDAANFRKALEVHGPQLTSKVRGNWSELYR